MTSIDNVEHQDLDHAPAMGMEAERIMSEHEMAEELDVPISTFRYHRSIGHAPPMFRVGRYWRGLRSTFLSWCREQQAQ